MRRVAVEIGAAGEQQTKSARDADVAVDERGVMIRVERFDRVQPHARERGNSRVEFRFSWMGERRDPAGPVEDIDHRFGTGPGQRHEGLRSKAKPAIERLPCVDGVAGRDHRTGNLRPAERATALASDLLNECSDVNRDAELPQPRADRLDTGQARRALRAKERTQPRIKRIEEIPEDMHVAPVLDGRNLDAADRLDAARARGDAHLGDGRRGVMVRDGQHGDAATGGVLDQLSRRAASVGSGGVEVEIDHRALTRAEEAPRRRERRVRP